jgi:uncharacterized protein (TIGR04168 family)
VRIAVLGDLHARFDAEDVENLDAAGLDLVCFVGDLGGPLHRDTLAVARQISRLHTRALLVPGNHDATSPLGVLAEATGIGRFRPGAGARSLARIDALRAALGPVTLAGYSLHPFPDHGVTVVAARPHAMEPRWLTFPQALEARFGVTTLAESADRLRALVDRAPGDLVFLAHNGPAGLGSGPRDPFTFYGRRDLGDPDLAAAIAYARAAGRRVLAVVAGHLHHRSADRDWSVVRDGIATVNAARVPRWFRGPTGPVRHHVELTIREGAVEVREILLPSSGARW